MKFIIIAGPQAVGKMAVGMNLAEKTGMRLFHNHMTIEMAIDIYGGFSKHAKKLVAQLRKDIFESVSESDLKGLIFTFMWAFNYQEDHDYVKEQVELFESKGAEVYIVELQADLDIRRKRNKTELRLKHKPSKRDLEWSENELVKSMDKYRLNSQPGEIKHKNYVKIDNSHLSIDEVADKIIETFDF